MKVLSAGTGGEFKPSDIAKMQTEKETLTPPDISL